MTAQRWTNPLTGSDILPTTPGDLITAAVAYWEDEVMTWRSKRPRKPADRAQKDTRVTLAVERLHRYRRARERFAFHPKTFERDLRLTLQLATDDLAPHMRDGTQSRAA